MKPGQKLPKYADGAIHPLFGELASAGLDVSALKSQEEGHAAIRIPKNSVGIVFHLSGKGEVNQTELMADSLVIATAGSRISWESTTSAAAVWIVATIERLRDWLEPLKPGLRQEIREAVFGGSTWLDISSLSKHDRGNGPGPPHIG
ncbi:MAG: hypothetical protein AAF585_24925 [Verrucomicrobiota bacterium]